MFILGAATERQFTNRNRARRYVRDQKACWVDGAGTYSAVETSAIAFLPSPPKKAVRASSARYEAALLSKATREDLKHTPVVMAEKIYRIGNDRMPVRSPRLKPAVSYFAGGTITTTVERSSKVTL